MKTLLSFLLFLFAPALAEGATFWVSPSGNNGNACTNTTTPQTSGAKLTIAAGMGCLASGDTLNIRAGTYTENIVGNSLLGKSGSGSGNNYTSPTTIQAYGTEIVTIMGGIGFGTPGPGVAIRYIIFKGDPTLHNLIFDCSTSTGCIGFGGGANGGSLDHIKLDGVEAKNVHLGPGIAKLIGVGGDDGVGDNIWITNAKLHGVTGCSSLNNPGHVLYIETSNNIIENSEIYDANGYGVHIYNQAPTPPPANNIVRNNRVHDTGKNQAPCGAITAYGILLSIGDGNQAYNNIVYNNMNGIAVASNNNLVYNNTIYGNGVGFGSDPCCYEAIRIDSGSGNLIKNNIVYGNAVNSIHDGGTGTIISNNLTTDPLFKNATAGDFSLTAGSPAIGAGLAQPGQAVNHLDGSVDIGAHQTFGVRP